MGGMSGGGHSAAQRAGCSMVGLLATAAAAAAALHHPLSPLLAGLGVAGLLAASAWRPALGFGLLLALLPWLGLMPWTGWILLEEFDLALLAVAAGTWLRRAALGPRAGVAAARPSWAWLWLLPLAGSTAVSAVLGLHDAGGLPQLGASMGWWQAYREPLNALRLAKPMLSLLCLLPPWWWLLSAAPEAATGALRRGLVALLVGVALQVLWERRAHTGLLNFSSDYRVVGLFWEMHVGGAALDAVLAMALPFAVMVLMRARQGREWVLAAVLVAGAAYAAMVTFSRILYAVLPLTLLLGWWLAARQAQENADLASARAAARARGRALAWLGGITLAAAWTFGTSGWRGLLALLGAAALALALAPWLRTASRAAVVGGFGAGLLGALALAVAALLPKAVYLGYALAFALTALALWRRAPGWGRGPALGPDGLPLAGFVAVVAGVPAVAVHWGGAAALPASLTCAALLLGITVAAAAAGRDDPWPTTWRWQASLVLALGVSAGLVGVFGGGAYMTQRMLATQDDGEGRQVHWARSLSSLSGTDWIAGQGLGRFLDHHAASGRLEDQVGDYRLQPGTAGMTLLLASGKHLMGQGAVYRLSQRVAEPAPGPVRLRLRWRAEADVHLLAQVCEKHLLYSGTCTEADRSWRVPTAQRPLAPGEVAVDGRWQRAEIELSGGQPRRGSPLAPRFMVFSVGLFSPGMRVEIDDLSLRDSAGRELLVNGGFEDGLARWFPTSDHHHLPWHAKNLAVHLVYEQGLLGLAAAALAFGAALWRLGGGDLRAHPLAPALVAALLGLLGVGLVDSLFDMPRVAWLGLWLLAVALTLPAPAPAQAARVFGGRPGVRPPAG